MFEKQREDMVRECVIDKGITDERLIKAMLLVPRHEFVQPAMRHQAYLAKSLPIGQGQTISHPATVAYMTHRLQLSGNERVLEIGTGSGYQSAVLASMGVKVYSIERIPELARKTQALFDRLGYYTIGVRIGDGTVGWSQHAPYDRIIVTAASPNVPEAYPKQLAEGGRIVMPVGDSAEQSLLIITKDKGRLNVIEEDSRTFVPLIGKKGWKL